MYFSNTTRYSRIKKFALKPTYSADYYQETTFLFLLSVSPIKPALVFFLLLRSMKLEFAWTFLKVDIGERKEVGRFGFCYQFV